MPSQVQATNSSHFSYRNSHEWMISQAITAVQLVLGMWYVTVLTMYLVKNKAFCKFTIRRFDKFVMPKMMLFAGVLYLCRLILTDVAIHVPYMGLQRCDLACEISTDAVVAVYTSAMLLVYTYLWIRMKVLFNTLKELQKTESFAFQTLTWIALAYMIISFLSITVFYIYPTSYICKENGCVARIENQEQYLVFAFIAIAVDGSADLFILVLIIRLLVKIRNSSKNLHKSTEGESHRKLGKAMKKLVVGAMICVISDLTVAITQVVIDPTAIATLHHLPYGIALFIKLVAVIWTSNDFNDILFPFRRRHTPASSRCEDK